MTLTNDRVRYAHKPLGLYAVRVTVSQSDGSTTARTYVPGEALTMSQEEFNEFAVGNLVGRVISGCCDAFDLDGYFTGVSFGTLELGRTKNEDPFITANECIAPLSITGIAVELVHQFG